KIARLLAAQDAIHIGRRTPQDIRQVGAIADQAVIEAMGVDGRQAMLASQLDDPGMVGIIEGGRHDHQASARLAPESGNGTVNFPAREEGAQETPPGSGGEAPHPAQERPGAGRWRFWEPTRPAATKARAP